MHRLAALTGAGISVASGLPTFDLRWRGIPARELLTLASFTADPGRFCAFFREALTLWRQAVPSAAHLALARARIPVITQNIDGLGTSLIVAPACYLPGYAAGRGAGIVAIDEAAEVKVPALVAEFLGGEAGRHADRTLRA